MIKPTKHRIIPVLNHDAVGYGQDVVALPQAPPKELRPFGIPSLAGLLGLLAALGQLCLCLLALLWGRMGRCPKPCQRDTSLWNPNIWPGIQAVPGLLHSIHIFLLAAFHAANERVQGTASEREPSGPCREAASEREVGPEASGETAVKAAMTEGPETAPAGMQGTRREACAQ